MTSRPDPDPRRLLAAHHLATELYRAHLPDEPRALAYLHSRGIIAATASAPPWTIGYAPSGWTLLRDHLYGHGFTEAELLAAGLVTTSRDGHVIDTFRDRVMFPIRNPAGQVVAFTGRDLSGRAGVPKYRNTTTTAIYRKSELLYGLAEQFDTHTKPAAVMLVEGPVDVVAVARMRTALGHNDYPDPFYAVAPCGTALTAQQVTLLASVVPPGTPVVSAFDADTAGAKAIDKSYTLLRDWPGPVDAMALPAGADPASLVASGPANALAEFHQARTPLVDLLVEHRLAPHLTRLHTRLEELARFDRDPSTESLAIRLDAARAVADLLAEVAQHDRHHAARLAVQVATRLRLDPLTMFEVIYPPDDRDTPDLDIDLDVDGPGPAAAAAGQQTTPRRDGTPRPDGREVSAPGGAEFPDLRVGEHRYARACPPGVAAATWIQHDPNTGHSAWVLAEGTADTTAGRDAARLAAQVAGRVAILVGAQKAIEIARAAVNAHFAGPDRTAPGDATICVLTSFDGDHPQLGHGRFTVAWAGDTRAYATIGRWFAALTVDHTLREHGTPPDQRHRAAVALLGEPAHPSSDAPGPHERRLIAQTGQRDWLATPDLLDLALAWRTARTRQHQIATARTAAETVEDRLRQLYPQAMRHYDQAIHAGVDWADAMRFATRYLPGTPRRPGDGALTSSVRAGPIGVNRVDLPATQILLAGRGLREADPSLIREAMEGHRPGAAIGNLRRLGGGDTVAMVVRPQPDQARDALTAARLACQDQATTATTRPASESFAQAGRARRAALAAVPASHAPAAG